MTAIATAAVAVMSPTLNRQFVKPESKSEMSVEKDQNLSKREQAKSERRDRIIAAALDLIELNGPDGFSMRDVAHTAGVSHATPFNLFGSKYAIVEKILEKDWNSFQSSLDYMHPADPVDRLFLMVELSVHHLHARASLYKALYINLRGGTPNPIFKRVNAPRHAYLVGLVADAQKKGLIRSSFPSDLIGRAVIHQFESALLDWVSDRASLARMEAEVCFGMAALLTGFANENICASLQGRLAHWGAALIAMTDQAPATAND